MINQLESELFMQTYRQINSALLGAIPGVVDHYRNSRSERYPHAVSTIMKSFQPPANSADSINLAQAMSALGIGRKRLMTLLRENSIATFQKGPEIHVAMDGIKRLADALEKPAHFILECRRKLEGHATHESAAQLFGLRPQALTAAMKRAELQPEEVFGTRRVPLYKMGNFAEHCAFHLSLYEAWRALRDCGIGIGYKAFSSQIVSQHYQRPSDSPLLHPDYFLKKNRIGTIHFEDLVNVIDDLVAREKALDETVEFKLLADRWGVDPSDLVFLARKGALAGREIPFEGLYRLEKEDFERLGHLHPISVSRGGRDGTNISLESATGKSPRYFKVLWNSWVKRGYVGKKQKVGERLFITKRDFNTVRRVMAKRNKLLESGNWVETTKLGTQLKINPKLIRKKAKELNMALSQLPWGQEWFLHKRHVNRISRLLNLNL